jgi:hypothetical protein
MILLISASQVARITGISHQHPAKFPDFNRYIKSMQSIPFVFGKYMLKNFGERVITCNFLSSGPEKIPKYSETE